MARDLLLYVTMITPRYLAGFTGHRQLDNPAAVRAALAAELATLKTSIEKAGGILEFYSSAAYGADTIACEEAERLGIPVHIILPKPVVLVPQTGELNRKEGFAADFWKEGIFLEDEWKHTQRLIQTAKTGAKGGSLHLATGTHMCPECYYEVGIQMLEAVDVLVAVWNGERAAGLGGTEQVVTHAKAIGKPLVIINSKTGQTRTEGSMTDAFGPDEMIEELNEIAKKTGAKCASNSGDADDLQECLDRIAEAEKDRFSPSIVTIILLHGIAALMAAIVTFKFVTESSWAEIWEKWKWLITAVELALVSYALWLGKRLHKKHTQESWILCRFAAELVRGFRSSVPLVDPLAPSVAVHDPKWRRFALSAALLVNASRAQVDVIQLRDDYLSTRLSKTHRDGQIGHYLKMNSKALRWWNLTGQISYWSALLAPPFVFLSLLNKLSKKLPFLDFDKLDNKAGWHWDEMPTLWLFVVLLPIALPLLAGVSNGIRQALDAGRRKERYPEMVKRLTELKTHLSGLQTRASITRTVSQSEEILLDELREWQLTAKTTGH